MKSTLFNNARMTSVLVAFILIVGTVVRFHAIDTSGAWTDEAFSLLLSAMAPAEILFHTVRDVHPPLYYLILHGWIQLFGDSVHAARFLSAVLGVVSVALAMWLMRLLSSRRAMLLGGLLVALLPIAVRYSQEVRMYALHATLMLGATIALVYWLKNSRSRWPLVFYCLLMVAGLYTHYFTVVCAFAHWLYLALLTRTHGEEKRYLLRPAWWVTNLIIATLFIPWLPSLIQQLRYSGFDWILPLTWEFVAGTVWKFLNFSDGSEHSLIVLFALPFMLIVMSVFIVVKGEEQKDKFLFLVTYAWSPIVLIVIVSFIKPMFVERYFVFAALAYPMIVAVLLDMLIARHKIAFLTLLGLIVLLEVDGLRSVYGKQPQDTFEFTNYDVLSRQVNSVSRAGDGLLVLDFFMYLPTVYYFRDDTHPLFYVPRKSDGTSTRPNAYQTWTLSSDKADQIYVETLDPLTTASGRIWLFDGVGGGSLTHKLPDNWQRLQTITVGATKAELIAIRPAGASPLTPAEPPTISHH
ncbi:glycosyltransferase family 39 protein [Pseudomonas kitaguniensis]|uniref:glycosyltransferase family 39 protein n=1 Tax=Pseudomonas kitaguniensis TaxID=2607908 RepID=UPI003D000EE6